MSKQTILKRLQNEPREMNRTLASTMEHASQNYKLPFSGHIGTINPPLTNNIGLFCNQVAKSMPNLSYSLLSRGIFGDTHHGRNFLSPFSRSLIGALVILYKSGINLSQTTPKKKKPSKIRASFLTHFLSTC